MIHEWFDWIVKKICFRPLYRLYTYVWWRNHSDTHICTTLSPGTTPMFWESHPNECQDIVHTQFQAVYTLISCGLWFFVLYQTYITAWHCCIVARSQKRMLKYAIKDAIAEIHQHQLSLQNKQVKSRPDPED